MPTYDYECSACSHKFEAFQSISEEPLVKCPACKKKKLKRLFGTGAGIIFKGSGFYQTDYRSDGYRKSAESDSKAASATSEPKSSDSKPSDSKPAESKASTPSSTSAGASSASSSKADGGGKGK
jgi:putative FmdB family regulatory protein